MTTPFSGGLSRVAAARPWIVYEIGVRVAPWRCRRRARPAPARSRCPGRQDGVDRRGRLGRGVVDDLVGSVKSPSVLTCRLYCVAPGTGVQLISGGLSGCGEERRSGRASSAPRRRARELRGRPAGVAAAGDAHPPPQVVRGQLHDRGVLAVDRAGVDEPWSRSVSEVETWTSYFAASGWRSHDQGRDLGDGRAVGRPDDVGRRRLRRGGGERGSAPRPPAGTRAPLTSRRARERTTATTSSSDDSPDQSIEARSAASAAAGKQGTLWPERTMPGD